MYARWWDVGLILLSLDRFRGSSNFHIQFGVDTTIHLAASSAGESVVYGGQVMDMGKTGKENKRNEKK